MRLGISLSYAGDALPEVLPFVQQADELGYHSVWLGEAWGTDGPTHLAYIAARTEQIKLASAILQIPARTPAMTAMTAMSIDKLSGGRMLLGLGMSGPQVIEGWHGVAYGKPLRRTREYVEIVRKAIAREEPLTYEGEYYEVPYQGSDASGLGKPLKSILHPVRPHIPIYLASIGPRNIALTGEIADGWLPIWYSPEREKVLTEHLDAGLSAAGRDVSEVDIATTVRTVVGDDIDACRDQVRPLLALYIGGMGSRGKNFYNDLVCRYGFEQAAKEIQDLYLDGKKREATALVPDELVDEVALVGPLGRVIDRLEAWKESRVGTVILGTGQPEVLEPLINAL